MDGASSELEMDVADCVGITTDGWKAVNRSSVLDNDIEQMNENSRDQHDELDDVDNVPLAQRLQSRKINLASANVVLDTSL